MLLNSNEVFLRVTNHTGQAEKIYLARLGFEPATFGLLVRCSTNCPIIIKILMYEDYCLDMEETRFCFEISNSPSTII